MAAVINFKGKGRGGVYMLILDERSSRVSIGQVLYWDFLFSMRNSAKSFSNVRAGISKWISQARLIATREKRISGI
jgi:hypothetical protein